MDKQYKPIRQPLSEDGHSREELKAKERLTVNPGDRIAEKPEIVEEKAKQVAVDSPDITGDWIKVPTYFIVEYQMVKRKRFIMYGMPKKNHRCSSSSTSGREWKSGLVVVDNDAVYPKDIRLAAQK